MIVLILFLPGGGVAAPAVVGGIVDLRYRDFITEGAVELSGDWEFYWNRFLIIDKEIGQNPKRDGFQLVPKQWNNFQLADSRIVGGKGFASYKIKLLLPQSPKKYSLSLAYVGSSCKVSLVDADGTIEEIFQIGLVGKSKEEYKPSRMPKLGTFSASGEVDLILEVSNFDHVYGGVWRTLVFGPEQQVYQKLVDAKIRDYFIFGSILIISLYALVQFGLRSREKAALYMGLFGIIVTLMLSFGRGYLAEPFSEFELNSLYFQTFTKAWYLNLAFTPLCFLMFLSYLFKQQLRGIPFSKVVHQAKKGFIIAGLFYALIILVTPVSFFSYLLQFYYTLSIFTCCWILYTLIWLSFFKRNPTAIISFVGVIIAMLTTVNDILFSIHFIKTGYFQHYGYLSLIFLHAIVLAVENSNARTKSELYGIQIKKQSDELQILNENLEEIVEERTSAAIKAEAKSSSLLEHAPDIIINIDRQFKILYINKQLTEVTCFKESKTIDDVIGQSIFDYFPDYHHDLLKKRLHKLTDSGSTEMTEFVVSRQGREQCLELRFAAIKRQHVIDEMMIIITDITKRKNAEKRLRSAQEELVEKAHKAGMADIAADILHNVGNILNSVKTSVDLTFQTIKTSDLLEGLNNANEHFRKIESERMKSHVKQESNGKLIEYYDLIERKMRDEANDMKQSMVKVVNHVQTIADIIAEQQRYAGLATLEESANLIDVVENALAMKATLINGHQIKLIKNFSPIPAVVIQKHKLYHILISLLTNAKDAMEQTPVDKRKLILVTERDENAVYLKVKDSGIGIEEKNLRRIFNMGYTTKKGRQGLGLHSSANYMSEMNGKMWAKSADDSQGAEFILSFPI